MKRQILYFTLCFVVGLCAYCTPVSAQHTFGIYGGGGTASGRFEPTQEGRPIWGTLTFGASWRYYSPQRVVGGVGADLEFIERGFKIATNTSRVDDPKDYLYYTRRVNSIMLPIIWQPHAYLFNHRLRVYGEAGVTFSYNLSSDYEIEKMQGDEKIVEGGDYHFSTVRDNRWGYGLCGGGGIAVLIHRFELNARARYYFGYSDILKNRNKHYDTVENFILTPLRSPLDNITITIGLTYRFNKDGFESWKPRRKREKNREVFEYAQ